MASRKAIFRSPPLETSYVAGDLSAGVGGENWQIDPEQMGYITRRPGQTPACATIDEGQGPDGYRSFVPALAFGTGRVLPAQNGINGIFTYSRPYLKNPFTNERLTREYLTTGSLSQTVAAVRPQEELVAIGMYPWLLSPLRVAQAAAPCNLFVYDNSAGAKTIKLASEDGLIAATLAGTQPCIDLISASGGLLTLNTALNAFGAHSALLSSLSYGTTRLATGDWVEVRVPMRLPTTEFFAAGSLYVGSSYLTNGETAATPFTAVQIGDYLYIAGAGCPLLRYDGSRVHAAGASPLKTAPATLGTSGTGLTGTFKYKILHRIYGPNGTYTDGPAYDLGSQVLANQSCVITIARTATRDNFLPCGIPMNATLNGDLSTVTAPMYKFSDLTYTLNFTSRIEFYNNTSVPPSRAKLWAGDNLSQIATGAHYSVESLNSDGDANLFTSPSGSSASVGDVYVILRTVAGGSIYYELREILTGTASSSDSTSDAILLAGTRYLDTAYYRGAPPTSTVAVCGHQQRIVVAHRVVDEFVSTGEGALQLPATTVSWSEPSTEHFPPENSFSLDSVCNNIVALCSVGDIMYILTDTGISYVQGTLIDPTTFTVGQIPGSLPAASAASAIVTPSGVIYVSSSGDLVHLTGFTCKVERNVLPREGYQYKLVTSVHHHATQRSYFFIPEDVPPIPATGVASDISGIPYGTKGLCLVVDEVSGARFLYSGIGAIGGATVHNGLVTYADRDVNLVSRISHLSDDAHSDFGTAIPVKLVSAFETEESPHLDKSFSSLTTYAPDAASEFTLGVKVEKDWDERRYVQQFNQSFRSGEGYAVEAYGVDPYGDGNIPVRVQDLANLKAKSLRVTFEHENITETPVISGWTLEYSDTTREGREE